MTDCFMLSETLKPGGGNRLARESVVVRRSLALGDSLAATVIADKLAQQGVDVVFQSHPWGNAILRRCRGITRLEEPRGTPDVDLDASYEKDPNRCRRHIHEMFVERANMQLSRRGMNITATNCRPRIELAGGEKESARAKFAEYPRPWVFICPRSENYPHRQVPDATWLEIARRLNGTVFWAGVHPAPNGIVDLNCRHLESLIVWMSAADLLITVDTGPMHMSAALGVPVVAITQSNDPQLRLNDQNDFISVSTDLDCLNCQKNLCPINAVTPPCQQVNVEGIVAWANARTRGRMFPIISAVIAIYQPEVEVLNRCLTAVLPQVDEVIVTRAQDGRLPPGAMQHAKIRYVVAPGRKIGYGRNTNYGVRWSNGKYILLLNDDVFLEPDVVSTLLAEMKPDVGLVSHLLRYPSGQIYHGGTWRNPGDRDWHHIDHMAWHPTFKEVTELENVCGTSVLTRRETFYQIGGFDEDYFLYAEDNDFSMRTRLHGWKIMYTPHASGIHLGHQSTKTLGDVNPLIAASNAIFHRKWDGYIRHNLHTSLGNFDYLKTT